MDGDCPTSFGVSWDAVPGASSYRVYRSALSCADARAQTLPLAVLAETEYVDSLPPPGALFYAVEAIEAGSGCVSERACAVGNCGCLPPGPCARRLRLSTAGPDLVLTWSTAAGTEGTWDVLRGDGPDPATWGPPLARDVVDQDPMTPDFQYVDLGALAAGPSRFYLVSAPDPSRESVVQRRVSATVPR